MFELTDRCQFFVNPEHLSMGNGIRGLTNKVMEPRTPPSAFLNSNYDASLVASILELRHLHPMPVERIVKYFNSNVFDLKKSTAHHLLSMSAAMLENLHAAMRAAVLSDSYMGCDETYSFVRVEEPNSKGKKVRKGYMRVAVGHTTGLVYFFYSKGSRKEEVFLDFPKDRRVIQPHPHRMRLHFNA